MSMLRKGDRVRMDETGKIYILVMLTPIMPDMTLLCCQCDQPAERFAGGAYCAACAPENATDVRADPTAIVSCICGESLDTARSEGTWTTGGIACEYRTCLHCHSTRAYAPVDVLRGRRVHWYRNQDSSEPVGEYDSFLEAITHDPVCAACELRRNGVILAKAWVDVLGKIQGWRVMPPEKETPLADTMSVIPR